MPDYYDKEKRKKYNHTYYMKNREREIERAKQYIKEHQEITTERNKNRRRSNIEEQEKNRVRARNYYHNNKEKFDKYKKKYIENNYDKIVAFRKFNNEIAQGRIKRQSCEVCGKENADAHHDDYNKPLEVRWLCRTHHKEWHLHNMPKRGVV